MTIKEKMRRWLPRNQFMRHVSVLATGTIASQAVLMLASPLLTHLYSPDDFGVLAIFVSMLSITGVVASLRYQLAIPLPEDEKKAASLVVLSVIVICIVTLLTIPVVVFFHEPIARALNSQKLETYLWILPIGILVIGIYQVFYYWALRAKAFTEITRTKMTQSVSSIAIQLGGLHFGSLALLAGYISGQAAGITSLGLLTIRGRWAVFKSIRLKNITRAAKRYKDFPIYSSWGGLLNNAGSELPSLLFAAFFSPVIAGLYLLTTRVLMMPSMLVGNAIAGVFFSHSSVAHRKGELAPLVASVHEKLAQIAMPPALVIIIAGPTLFSTVFGEEWQQAGTFAAWLAPWAYVIFMTSPLSMLVDVLEKQRQELAFQLVLFSTRIAAITAGAYAGSATLAIALFSLSGTVCWAGFLFWVIHASGNKATTVVVSSVKAFLWSLGLVAPLVAVYLLPSHSTLPFWISALCLSALLITLRYANLIKKAW